MMLIFFLAYYIIWPTASLSGRFPCYLRIPGMYKEHYNFSWMYFLYY